MCSGPLVGIRHAVMNKILRKKNENCIFTHRDRRKIVPKICFLLFRMIFHFPLASISQLTGIKNKYLDKTKKLNDHKRNAQLNHRMAGKYDAVRTVRLVGQVQMN